MPPQDVFGTEKGFRMLQKKTVLELWACHPGASSNPTNLSRSRHDCLRRAVGRVRVDIAGRLITWRYMTGNYPVSRQPSLSLAQHGLQQLLRVQRYYQMISPVAWLKRSVRRRHGCGFSQITPSTCIRLPIFDVRLRVAPCGSEFSLCTRDQRASTSLPAQSAARRGDDGDSGAKSGCRHLPTFDALDVLKCPLSFHPWRRHPSDHVAIAARFIWS
jgi:hypothetical protein